MNIVPYLHLPHSNIKHTSYRSSLQDIHSKRSDQKTNFGRGNTDTKLIIKDSKLIEPENVSEFTRVPKHIQESKDSYPSQQKACQPENNSDVESQSASLLHNIVNQSMALTDTPRAAASLTSPSRSITKNPLREEDDKESLLQEALLPHTLNDAKSASSLGSKRKPIAIDDRSEISDKETLFESDDDPDELLHPNAEIPTPNKETETRKAIYALLEEAHSVSVPDLLDPFEKLRTKNELIIGSVSQEELEMQELEMQKARIRAMHQDAEKFRQAQEDLIAREKLARIRVKQEADYQRRKLKRKEQEAAERDKQRARDLHQLFRSAEDYLKRVIENQESQVKEQFGVLQTEDPVHNQTFRRKELKVDWLGIPQPVEVRLEMMRALKDKLPPGEYVILVSVYDRLGGHPVRWSNHSPGVADSKTWAGVSTPVRHGGRFYNTELKFEQSVFVACPSKCDSRPYMLFVFELFVLRGRR